MSNAELIATIRVRVDAATKGPWEAVGPFVAEFIAHARQDIPNLLTALEKSEAEVVRLQATITAVQSLVVPIISAGGREDRYTLRKLLRTPCRMPRRLRCRRY